MALVITRTGFGQVEPNHLSAQRTGQIYAQLPAVGTMNILENGQFVKYDYANGVVNLSGAGEWMMVFNEVKRYDDPWREHYKDYAMQKTDFVDNVMTPRVFKINIGDIYTTNCIGAANTSGTAQYAGISLAKGETLTVANTGYLVKAATGENAPTSYVFEVVDETTMPDGQPAVKIMRIK